MQDIISHSLDNHTQSPHRDYLFDNIKALLIFLVAAVHFEAADVFVGFCAERRGKISPDAAAHHVKIDMGEAGKFAHGEDGIRYDRETFFSMPPYLQGKIEGGGGIVQDDGTAPPCVRSSLPSASSSLRSVRMVTSEQ